MVAAFCSTDIARRDEANDPAVTAETLLTRLRIFAGIRWLAILGVIVILLGARYGFHINFPTTPVYVICACIAAYNLAFVRQIRRLAGLPDERIIAKGRPALYIYILLDMLSLTVLIHYSGGIENPFIFIFVLLIILASIELSSRAVYLLSTAAVGMVVVLVGLEYLEIIPHINLEGFVLPIRYRDTARVLAVVTTLAAILYGTSFIITSVVGELTRRQRKLEEQRRRFLRFIGIAAHDLKAPLGAVQGYLWTMQGGYAGKVSKRHKQMLERSSTRITELLSLISDLLDIPRIETGQIVPEKQACSPGNIVAGCVESQRVLAEEKGLELKTVIPEGLPEIYGSPPRLQQAVTNLVNNAIKYTPEGSVSVAVKERNRNLLIEIADTGAGIHPEDLPHIFEDFYRAGNTQGKGTGLGLPITRRIIEAHGGRILVESPCPDTGKGSRFTIVLPGCGAAKQKVTGGRTAPVPRNEIN